MTVEEISALNPELRRGRTPPGREGWDVRVPADRLEALSARWARRRAQDHPTQPYVVRFGESVAMIAHRYRTRERDLVELNGILDDETIGAGTTLLVPAVEPREEETPEEAPVVAVPQGVRPPAGTVRVIYRVSRGDTLWELSRFCNTRVAAVAERNHLDPHATLHPPLLLI